jgi:hypothetical protein
MPLRSIHNRPNPTPRTLARLGWMTFAAASAACGGGSLPRPEATQVLQTDYVVVPFAPRPPRVEIVPARPSSEAVWVDGSWSWEGDRYRWEPGAWVHAPPGGRHARWVVVRRTEDGQLFFAPSSWKNAKGEPLPQPPALVEAKRGGADDD